MVSEFVLGIGLSLGIVLIGIIAGVIAWVVKRLWDMNEDIERMSNSYEGTPAESGHLQDTRKAFESIHQRLDDVEDLVCSIERRRTEEHEEVKEYLSDIIDVMRDEGINGGLPEVTDD